MHACASAVEAFVEFHRTLIVASGLNEAWPGRAGWITPGAAAAFIDRL